MDHRIFQALAVILLVLFTRVAAVPAQTSTRLQITMIGNGAGPYYAPAGQLTGLKVEILNLGPHDVYLLRGEAFLDPNLSGNWQLVHSEDTNNFHLGKLQSAIWAFDLAMPNNIEAANTTNGVPQVMLLIQIIYSTTRGQNETASEAFNLSVPGATLRQSQYWIWLILAGISATLLAAVLVYLIARHSRRKFRP